MKTSWTSHLKDEKEIDRVKKTVRASKGTLDRQKEILGQWLEEINSIEINPNIYDKPSWAALQAHYNGERRAYKRILNLITLDQEGDNDR